MGINGYKVIKTNQTKYSTVCLQAHSSYRCGGRLSRRDLESGKGLWEAIEEPVVWADSQDYGTCKNGQKGLGKLVYAVSGTSVHIRWMNGLGQTEVSWENADVFSVGWRRHQDWMNLTCLNRTLQHPIVSMREIYWNHRVNSGWSIIVHVNWCKRKHYFPVKSTDGSDAWHYTPETRANRHTV